MQQALFYFGNFFQSFLKSFRKNMVLYSVLVGFMVYYFAVASGDASSSGGESHGMVATLLWIAVLLIAAKLSSLVEKIGQPAVLGELVIGVILGNLVLAGINWFEPIKTDIFVPFLAELGVIVLLFQVGLESNIQQMKKVGIRALLVALIGVVLPFVLGTYMVGPWLLPGLSSNAYLFIGAALTATSVGITARVFKDLGKLKLPEAQIVLGAAVIDDVLGLILLAIISALVALGSVSAGAVGIIVAKAISFLVGSIIVGQLTAPFLGKWLSKIHTGVAMKFTLAVSFALLYSYVAGKIGLAPIVGAFAAGLVLDPVHFKSFKRPQVAEDLEKHVGYLDEANKAKLLEVSNYYNHKHVEDLIEPLAHFFVPIFFVYTGMTVKLETLFDTKILLVALGITVVAFIGKYVAGLAAGNVNKHLVGFGMVPRGEVGLIFATIGLGLGVISDEVFSIIVIMVILTTLLTPPILSHLLKKHKEA